MRKKYAVFRKKNYSKTTRLQIVKIGMITATCSRKAQE